MERPLNTRGPWTMPFAVNISHAAADGWHTAQFLNDLQALLDRVDLEEVAR